MTSPMSFLVPNGTEFVCSYSGLPVGTRRRSSVSSPFGNPVEAVETQNPVRMSVVIRGIGVIIRRDLFVLAGAYRMHAGANLGY